MRRIFAIVVISVVLVSCYDDYIKDFDYNSVYFPFQTNVRTLVVGEGMKIQIGADLSGVRENDHDRVVEFQIDNSLINAATLATMKAGYTYVKEAVAKVNELKLLPSNYYSLSDNAKIIIKAGEHSGMITLRPDSALFLADAATLVATYALPLRITKADADTVLISKNYAVIGLKYENMLFGNYWHGGVTVEKNASGAMVSEKKYYTLIPSPDSKTWKLTTVDPFSLVTNGVSDVSASAKAEFKLTLSGGNVSISSMPGATYQVQPEGTSTYNQAKLLQNRKIFLNYKYQVASGNWCYATDTLTFRNRIRDGVNEWQDENPENYK